MIKKKPAAPTVIGIAASSLNAGHLYNRSESRWQGELERKRHVKKAFAQVYASELAAAERD